MYLTIKDTTTASFDEKSNDWFLEDGYKSNQNLALNGNLLIETNNNIQLIDIFSEKKCLYLDEEKEENDISLYILKQPFNSEKSESLIFDAENNSMKEGDKIYGKNEQKILSPTKNSSHKKDKIEKIKLFDCNLNPNPSSNLCPNRKYFRVDDAKKHYKVAISQFVTEQINKLIKNSNLPKILKKKIHLPHFKLFTSNIKELDNFEFLSFDIKTVFTYGKTENNLQGSNDLIISKILNYNKFPEKSKEIKDFLNLKYEDIIKLFYKSEKFKEFKENEMTKFFNAGIEKEKKISLLEDEGLVKLFKMTKKKRKRELFSSKLII